MISVAPMPAITRQQMEEVDRVMVDDFGIDLRRMMELAGARLAEIVRRTVAGGTVQGLNIVVLAGSSGNGGGAFVSARNLTNFGANVHVASSKPPPSLREVVGEQVAILSRVGVPIVCGSAPDSPDIIVDGLIGYGLDGPPRGETARLIRWANRQTCPIVALDLPSGLNATSGQIADPCITADVTMTIALPKTGLVQPDARRVVGALYVADIGVPRNLYKRYLGLDPGPIFERDAIVRVF